MLVANYVEMYIYVGDSDQPYKKGFMHIITYNWSCKIA